ncbi:MAG: hypothetical protein II171_06310 [Bacteroidales bacterium]|nr:hypothetical protein [Bacteroidales bacterium]
MKKCLTLVLLFLSVLCRGANGDQPPVQRHQVRVGWGDMLFETMAFYPGLSATGMEKYDFGYTGHVFAEYRYLLNQTIRLGIQSDVEGIFWKEALRDANRKPTGDVTPVRSYNVSLVPTFQFRILDTEWVDLWTGLGAGVLIAFDNARQVELAPEVNFTLLGVEVGKGPWTGTLELGGMNALRNANQVYLLGSRLLSVSVNYRW